MLIASADYRRAMMELFGHEWRKMTAPAADGAVILPEQAVLDNGLIDHRGQCDLPRAEKAYRWLSDAVQAHEDKRPVWLCDDVDMLRADAQLREEEAALPSHSPLLARMQIVFYDEPGLATLCAISALTPPQADLVVRRYVILRDMIDDHRRCLSQVRFFKNTAFPGASDASVDAACILTELVLEGQTLHEAIAQSVSPSRTHDLSVEGRTLLARTILCMGMIFGVQQSAQQIPNLWSKAQQIRYDQRYGEQYGSMERAIAKDATHVERTGKLKRVDLKKEPSVKGTEAGHGR